MDNDTADDGGMGAAFQQMCNLVDVDAYGSQLTGMSQARCRQLRLAEDGIEAPRNPPGHEPDPDGPTTSSDAAPSSSSSSSNDTFFDLEKSRNDYCEAYDMGAHHLINLFLDEELENRTLQGVRRPNLSQIVFLLLVTMCQEIVRAVLMGYLPFKARSWTFPALRAELNKLMNAAKANPELPGVYGLYLVDDGGESPPPEELRQGIPYVREYEHNEDSAMDIEGVMFKPDRSRIDAGFRRYYSQQNQLDTPPQPCRIEQVENFCDQLEQRLDHVTHTRPDQPLPVPLCEFGFSRRLIKRLKEHSKHTGSNYIM